MTKRKKPTLYVTRGLPGSGKSTWAAQEVISAKQSGQDTVIVNKDDIREELSKKGWVWSHEAEKEVVAARDKVIVGALSRGESVISPDCNFGGHKDRLQELARTYGAEFCLVDFTNVPVEECIARDAKRPEGKRVGKKGLTCLQVAEGAF